MAQLHAVHKLLADHARPQRSSVEIGEILEVEPDVFAVGVGRNANEAKRLKEDLAELGVRELANRDRIVVYFDHAAPAPFPEAAAGQKAWFDFFRENDLQVADPGSGIAHLTLPEQGYVRPGTLIGCQDSHTPTMGAVGSFAPSIAGGSLSLFAIGRTWLEVPKVVRYELNGSLQPGVFPRDVALHVNHIVGQRGALGMTIEYAGSFVDQLSMDGRFTLCNTATEMGAMSAYIQPDDITLSWVNARSSNGYTVYETDPDFAYEEVRAFDVSQIGPQVAAPHAPDNVKPIDEVEGTQVDQAFLGSCANGRLEDIAIAAEVLRGRKVHPNVKFIVTPGSREVLKQATKLGYIEVLHDANAVVTHANCGSCATLHGGILAPGEVCIACNTRNFQGRMGPGASIYLGSPATVAASAVEGRITDPRKLLS
jgi:3-isopropylmalate/(R)-2-methylmalate dehydratase large subunit